MHTCQLPTHGARCGVRQPCCRSSRAHNPARGTSLTLLVARMLWMLVRAPRLSPRRMHTCQLPTTACPASGSLAESSSGRAITRRIDCLARSSCAWCAVWSAAAWLPQQSGSRPGAWHTVDPAGQEDAVGARPCSQTVAQAHAHLPITNDSLPCFWLVGREQLQSSHHSPH